MAEDIPRDVRARVYKRDGYKCRWCGRMNTGIDLHHILYRSSGGQHLDDNLISLCRQDHNLMHSSKQQYQPVLLDLVAQDPNVTGMQLLRWQKPADARSGNRLASLRKDEASGPVGRLFAGQELSKPAVRVELHADRPRDLPSPKRDTPVNTDLYPEVQDFDECMNDEVVRQFGLWGEQNHPDGTGLDGDVISADNARALCEAAFRNNIGTWRHILAEEIAEAFAESDEDALESELIQCAAVIKSWVASIHRRQLKRQEDGAV